MSKSKLVIAAFALSFLAGCGESDDRIRINGIVFSDQKPLEGASIAFVGNNGGVISSAVSNAKGEFSLRAAAGKNKVAVSKKDTTAIPPSDPNADQSMPTDAEYAKMVKSAPKSLVAERYTDPEKSGIVVDVVAGMASVDVEVTSK